MKASKKPPDATAGQQLNHERRRWPRQPGSETEEPLTGLGHLQPLHFSTRNLPAGEQFAAWKSHVAPLVDVILPEGLSETDPFPIDHIAWNFGSMVLVQQQVPAHSYFRSAAKLRSSSIDHWSVGLLRSGKSWTEVNGRVAQGEPNKVEFRSLGVPFSGRTIAAESLWLYLPRDLFSQTATIGNSSNNLILSGALANLLIDHINSVEMQLRNFTAADLPAVVRTTRDLITTCVSSSFAEDRAVAEQNVTVALMERARQYIQQNLSSADLTPDALCRALGVSRTHLYQIFEPSGGVLHYIQRRRLLATHAALSDPNNRRHILEIGENVGFSSAANFSRAFSKEFGYSPREARNAASPARLVHSNSSTEKEKSNSFEDWLKALGN